MDSVTIEALKAQLTTLPEGQTADLGALLVAAKIDLTVEDIVGPPLTQVKRIMEQKKLSDWQVQLCIKIRRRKKNTVRYFSLSAFRLAQLDYNLPAWKMQLDDLELRTLRNSTQKKAEVCQVEMPRPTFPSYHVHPALFRRRRTYR